MTFPPRSRFAFAASIVLIVIVVLPWRSFQDHSHWSRIRWVPFVSPPIRAVDIFGNMLLYVPFGFFHAYRRRQAAVWRSGLAYAVLLAGATEFTQVFSHGRFPSVQDILMNVIGAGIGIGLSRQRLLARELLHQSVERER